MSQIIAFVGSQHIASGDPSQVVAALRAALVDGARGPVLAFDAVSSRPVELDLRPGQAPQPEAEDAHRGPGRPKLGVTAREVTLLPRHWDWLAQQSGGASATLRRLVEEARRAGVEADAQRQARESLYRFITAMAGDAPGYEEATRALFAGDGPGFASQIAAWPADIARHARDLSGAAF